MSDLVGNPDDRYSQNEAHILVIQKVNISNLEIAPEQGAYLMITFISFS